MIPIRLQLKNFLSYGPEVQTIDFEPYKLICLSGKNGHGKSALLDAITWALWGQARKLQGVAKSDEALLRLGQTHMMVCLDFTFNEQIYRVKREFALTNGKPYAALEIGILNQEHKTIQALTEKRMRDTQEKINTILGITYDSFINSAFLRQGQSNEFSKKTAKDRKEILSTILGLDAYEQLRKRAMEKSRIALAEKQQYEKLQLHMEVELAQTDNLKLKMGELEKTIKNLANQENTINQEIVLLDTQQQQQAKLHQEYQLKFQEKEQIAQQLSNEQEKTVTTIHDWRRTHHQLLTLPDHSVLEKEKKKLQTNIKTEQEKMHALFKAKETYLAYKEQEQQIILAHKKEHAQRMQTNLLSIEQLALALKNNDLKIKECESQQNKLQQEQTTLVKTIESLEKQLTRNNKTLSPRTTLGAQFEKQRERYHTYVAQRTSITSELDSITQKKKLTHDASNPSCPLCEQNLSASRKRFLHEQFNKQESWLTHRLTRLTRVLTKLKTILVEQHKTIEKLNNLQEQQTRLQTQFSEYRKQSERITNTTTELKKQLSAHKQEQTHLRATHQEAQKKFKEVETDFPAILDKHSEYQTIKKSMIELEKKLLSQTANQMQYDKLNKQLELVENQLQLHAHTQEKQTEQKHRKQSVDASTATIRILKKDLATRIKKLPSISLLEEQNKQLATRYASVKKELSAITQQKQETFEQKGSLETQKTKLEKIKKELKEHEQSIKKLIEVSNDYQEIGKALGKDGIQALLIEEIIPEIEQEANELLTRLTDNQAHLFIESVKDLKKGGTKETLDIKISDAAGLRPYELFSGGEAFRIDFALRIAISKLLARRAGASLQTLIIDEGFGSQDEEGLAHIMDAIYKIQDDFEKVIIVSHLSSMKDQFPVHFIVEKGVYGSTINVMHQG